MSVGMQIFTIANIHICAANKTKLPYTGYILLHAKYNQKMCL